MTVLTIDISGQDFKGNGFLHVFHSQTSIPVELLDKHGTPYDQPVVSDSEGKFPDVYFNHKEAPTVRVEVFEVFDGISRPVVFYDNLHTDQSFDQIPSHEGAA